MEPSRPAEPARPSRTEETYHRLRQRLHDIAGVPTSAIKPVSRFEVLLSPQERCRVWDQLHEEGIKLPGLTLSSRVFLLVAVCVLAPVLGLYLLLKHWSALCSLAELGFLARKLTRPWAIHPPLGCETVREAVLQLTPFSHQDYRAGLWPRQDIADKVRLMVSQATGIPFAKVTEQTRLDDIFC